MIGRQTTNDGAQALLAEIINDPLIPPAVAAKCRGIVDALRDRGLDGMREAFVLVVGMMAELQEHKDELSHRALRLGEVETLSRIADRLRSIATDGIDHTMMKDRLQLEARMLDKIYEKNKPRW